MKTAKLFQKGQSQDVRLPKEFRFKVGEVFIKKEGNAVIIMPAIKSREALIQSLDIERDKLVMRALKDKGWKVIRIWENMVSKQSTVSRLRKALGRHE